MSSIPAISILAGALPAQADVPDSEPRQSVPVQGVVGAAQAQPPAKRSTEEMQQQFRAAAEQIESYLRHVNTNLEFRVDDAAGKVVITVRERATGDLIRQIPSEEALAIAAQLDEYRVSGLLDQKI